MFGYGNKKDVGPPFAVLIQQSLKLMDYTEPKKEPAYRPDEIEILRMTYPNSGAPACAELLPNHTINSIHHMANRMGLKNRPTWEQPEIEHLKTAIYSGTSIKNIVVELSAMGHRRTYGGAKQKIRELKAAAAS